MIIYFAYILDDIFVFGYLLISTNKLSIYLNDKYKNITFFITSLPILIIINL